MDSFTWATLEDLGSLKERLVERWLWTVDIAVELSMGIDVHLILRGIFSVLKEFVENRNIEARSLHLLQEVLEQVFSTSCSNGTISDSEDGRLVNTTKLNIIQTALRRWHQHADVATACLHVLSTLSENDRFCDMNSLHADELLLEVSNVMNDHGHSKKVQLRGMILFHRLLEHSSAGFATMTEDILRVILERICFNLRFNDDDANLVQTCCKSLDILVRKLAHHLIVLMTDELVPLVAGVFDAQHISGNIGVVSLCLLILEKLALEESHLLSFCSSSDVLTKIGETLVRISDLSDSRTSYGYSIIALFNLLSRVIPEPHILSRVVQHAGSHSNDDDDATKSFVTGLYVTVKSVVGRSAMDFAKEFELPESQQSKLADLAEEMLHAMRQIVGRLDGDEDVAENDEQNPDSDTVDHETIIDERRVEVALASADDEAAGSDDEGAHGGDYGGVETEPDWDGSTELLTVEVAVYSGDVDGREGTELDNADRANIIQVAAVSQQQAAVTMVRAEIMHRLFIDATQKIENLIMKGQELQTQVECLMVNKRSGTEEETGHQEHHISETGNEAKILTNDDDECDLNGSGLAFDDISKSQPALMPDDDGNSAVDRSIDGLSVSSLMMGASGDRLWLAIAGTIEALTIITLTAETGSKYGFESTFEYSTTKASRRALLQHGDKTLLKPSQWAKYEPVADGTCYAVGSEIVSTEMIYALATQSVAVFLHIKDGSSRLNGGAGRSKQSIISLTLFRQVLKNMNVFLMRDVDIVFSRLGVPSISLFGFCFALMLCIQKLEKRWSCAEDIVMRLTSVLDRAVAAPTKFLLPVSSPSRLPHFEAAQSSGGVSVCTDIENQLTADDMSELLENLSRDSRALSFIFAAYSSSGKAGGSQRGDASGGSQVVSFEDVSKFAHDFDLYPNVVVHSQLFKIFGDVVANSSQYSNTVSSHSPVNSKSRRVFRRDHPPPTGSGGEPLLLFHQFEALIILIALRSSYFREAVEALTNLDRLLTAASPQRGTLVRAMQAEPAGRVGHRAAFVLAVERINRLIKWLNSSRGKDRLASRARSIASPGLTLKTVSLASSDL